MLCDFHTSYDEDTRKSRKKILESHDEDFNDKDVFKKLAHCDQATMINKQNQNNVPKHRVFNDSKHARVIVYYIVPGEVQN